MSIIEFTGEKGPLAPFQAKRLSFSDLGDLSGRSLA